ncbi:MAG TPA: ATP synthase F1 subunit delta [Flavitalea sp.]|nr:ATP synthase F1 subunit delta [Flavitalea sp.]
MLNTRVAGRYAKSLIDLSLEQNMLEKVYEDMLYLKRLLKDRELVLMLKSPIVTADKKQTVLNALTDGRISDLTAKFNTLLIKKGRETNMPEVIDAFIEQYKAHKEIRIVKLTTATEVSEDMKRSIVSKIDGMGEMTNVELVSIVDPSIIGGFILQVGDQVFDTSISNELNNISKQFQNNDYIYKVR